MRSPLVRDRGLATAIYLDHAATTPLDPDALEAMEPYLLGEFGNASSVHALGQHARMALEEARRKIASAIGAQASEIVFTSGGTESDNAAIRGVLQAHDRSGHIVTSAIEHEAVLEACADLERSGIEVSYVQPGPDGILSVDSVAEALRENTVLVSVMHANNEIGSIQPVTDIGRLCRERGVTFHCDAVQTVGTIPVNTQELSVDLLSFSAHKFYGPKGVGGLYVRNGSHWRSQQFGGGQERNRRSGTENVAGIVGMAAALEKAVGSQKETGERLRQMREYLFDSLMVNAVANGSRDLRLPGNVNLSFPGLNGEALVIALDQAGIMASSGSACSSGSTEPSHVLSAITSAEIAAGALRLTLGRENTWDDVRQAVGIIGQTVSRLYEHANSSRQVGAVVP